MEYQFFRDEKMKDSDLWKLFNNSRRNPIKTNRMSCWLVADLKPNTNGTQVLSNVATECICKNTYSRFQYFASQKSEKMLKCKSKNTLLSDFFSKNNSYEAFDIT